MLTESGFRVKSQSPKISTKFNVENELLPKKGHLNFFPPQSSTAPGLPNMFVGELFDKGFLGNLPPKGGTIRQISIGHNSGPELDIDKRSTAFFTVRRFLAVDVKICRQVALQVGDLEKVPRPQNFQTPISQNRIDNFSRNFAWGYGVSS